MSDYVKLDLLEKAEADNARLESQNQALQEENERLKREFVQQARQTNANADIVDALQARVTELEVEVERWKEGS